MKYFLEGMPAGVRPFLVEYPEERSVKITFLCVPDAGMKAAVTAGGHE
ncbi:hypothetical protein [Methylococcus sp. Mc7]|nr:hypothetical protein [Methylococcus sp. Mc7]QXP85467.1 hypothetical protein KW115_07075 [Methylococcus sp. Mc7]